MDTTDCLDLPYPQCAPPLTKDASDIEQLRDLALDIDAEVQQLNDGIIAQLVRPDACRMSISVVVTSTLAENTFFLDSITFDNTAGSQMGDFTNGVIRIIETGWYLIGCWMESGVATDVQTRARFIVNGNPATNFQGPSGLAQANIQHLSIQDMLFLQAGDGVTIQSRNGSPGTSVDYAVRVWVVQVVPGA